MDPLLKGIFLSVSSMALAFFGKVFWDHYKSGRTEKGEYLTMQEFKEHKNQYCAAEGDYLTVEAFEKHREHCCAIGLKKEFNVCKQESCTIQANHDHRLVIVEEKLKDGQVMFQTLNDKMDDKFDSWSDKFDKLIQSVVEIQVTLKYALDRERKDNGL